MATVIELPISVPALPSNYEEKNGITSYTPPLTTRKLLPIGPAYVAHARRTTRGHSFEEDDKHVEEEKMRAAAGLNGDGAEEDDLGVGEEPESEDLLSLDPKEWKKQDHYAVLGLSHLRYRATPDQIKVAHRKKVLKHHPDKKAGLAGDSNDDAFFKCIQKAFEVLFNPEKRRQFDSVDPQLLELEQDTPSVNDVKKATEKNPKAFFDEYGPVFEREARFSKKEPVPMLGGIDDSKEAVEGFYDFWYNFDSWRSFEYMDKEVNEGSDTRDDKRHTEKKNKSDRARRKKEDTARLRTIVDNALGIDPRIKRIKQEEKEAREAKKKKGKVNGSGPSTAELDAQKKKEEEEAAKKKDEEEKAAAKKAKTAAANAAKKARRAARAVEGGEA